jgi:cytochrome c peroxidase
MFSDFRQHVAGVPQVAPSLGNVVFDGPGANEDFGLEQVTGSSADRYAFRTSPLRNVALQPAFMHNGAFVRLEDAIRYHLDAVAGAATYTTARFRRICEAQRVRCSRCSNDSIPRSELLCSSRRKRSSRSWISSAMGCWIRLPRRSYFGG